MADYITVKIDKESLKQLFSSAVHEFSNKVGYGASHLFCDYYAELIDDGWFDDSPTLDIPSMVENDIINDLMVVTEQELRDDWGIDIDKDGGSDKILYSDGMYFLIDARG